MFKNNKKKKGSVDAVQIFTVDPILLSFKPLPITQDEDFLIGRREKSVCNLFGRTHSHIRITEVAPSNSALINGKIFSLFHNINTPAILSAVKMVIFR